jgi:hypothetical protein
LLLSIIAIIDISTKFSEHARIWQGEDKPSPLPYPGIDPASSIIATPKTSIVL